jgi:hypothetical protein
MTNYTKFRVIKIIDDYSVVINGGLSDDVSLNDKIEIYLEGEEIIDPYNNNKPLGTLDFIKETLKVTEVYPDFAVCQKIKLEKIHNPSALQLSMMHAVSSFANYTTGKTTTVETIEKINVNKSEITGRKKGDLTIIIGDFARIALS